jgi:hypothetical protein
MDGAEMYLQLIPPTVLQQSLVVLKGAVLAMLLHEEWLPTTIHDDRDREVLTELRLKSEVTGHLRRFITFSHHEIFISYTARFTTLCHDLRSLLLRSHWMKNFISAEV